MNLIIKLTYDIKKSYNKINNYRNIFVSTVNNENSKLTTIFIDFVNLKR